MSARWHLWAQAVVEQQLGCPMHRYLSDTAEEEKLHVRRGTIDSLESHMKMRFVAPGDWIRIKFDLQPLVRQACGDAYLYSRRQAGELLHLVYFRPIRALGDTSLLSVFQQLQSYLGRSCALDVPSQHLTIQLPPECLLVNVIHCWTCTSPALQWIRIETSSLMTTVFCSW